MSIHDQEFSDRIEVINSRDGLAYALACAEEGIEPELPDLAEQGEAEHVYDQLREAAFQKWIDKNAPLVSFVSAAEKYDLDSVYNARDKQRLLQKQFPMKFGSLGAQDISDYSIPRIGRLFENVLKSYQKRLRIEISKPIKMF